MLKLYLLLKGAAFSSTAAACDWNLLATRTAARVLILENMVKLLMVFSQVFIGCGCGCMQVSGDIVDE